MKATWFVMSVVGSLALGYTAGSEAEEMTLAKGGRLVIPGEGGAKVVVGFLGDADREPGVWIYDDGGVLRGEMVVVASANHATGHASLGVRDETGARAAAISVNNSGGHGADKGLMVFGARSELPIVKLGTGFGVTSGVGLSITDEKMSRSVRLGLEGEDLNPGLRLRGRLAACALTAHEGSAKLDLDALSSGPAIKLEATKGADSVIELESSNGKSRRLVVEED